MFSIHLQVGDEGLDGQAQCVLSVLGRQPNGRWKTFYEETFNVKSQDAWEALVLDAVRSEWAEISAWVDELETSSSTK